MSRWISGFIIISSMLLTTSAYAQETTPGPGKAEVTIIPGGMTFFTNNTTSAEPSFGNYDIGGAFAGNFNRIVGVEGELGGSLGITQTLAGLTAKEKTPNMLSYSGNLVVNAAGHSVVPYATGGIGALTVYNRPVLGINTNDTFLTGNVGGGLKWFAGNGRWGLRGDYRFLTVRSKNTASEFFGLTNRYANRIYGAVILNAVK
jgi:hypothetical protein